MPGTSKLLNSIHRAGRNRRLTCAYRLVFPSLRIFLFISAFTSLVRLNRFNKNLEMFRTVESMLFTWNSLKMEIYERSIYLQKSLKSLAAWLPFRILSVFINLKIK